MQERPATRGESKEPGGDAEQFGADFTTVITSLQQSVEQFRRGAQQEMARMRARHEEERARLEAEIAELRTRGETRDRRIQQLRGRTQSVLEEYRGDLEGQVERAASARQRLDSLLELLDQDGDEDRTSPSVTPPASEGPNPMAGAAPVGPQDPSAPVPPVPGNGGRQASGDRPFRIAAVTAQRGAEPPEDATVAVPRPDRTRRPGETTTELTPEPPSPGTTQISISGVSSVSAMMWARKAVESLPSIEDVESRYVSDGTLYFSVRATEDAEAIARSLTNLPDPQLRSRTVTEHAIELEM